MIRKLIGAAIGARVAKQHPAVGGATGVVLATAVPFIISRVSLPAMVALGVGGYVAKRFMDKNTAEQATKPTPPPAPVQQ
ncbi:hypothetical protein [uncultured Erythrobacter sp.]|uniref:hypothetical protein n=1 Tax=uncultured Erythrobacter sp. TaxID=263913 RepID=UPI0026582487|nr:hypothetical protein [uncultured Erythrobacter sp.]